MRRAHLLLTGLLVAAAIPSGVRAATPGTDSGTVRPPGSTGPYGNERLSDEQGVTRWSYARTRGKIRTAPRLAARSFARLRFLTEDRAIEVYIVLRSHVDSKQRVWVQVRVPMRPNGRTGWVLRDYLDGFHVNRDLLRVNRRTLRATFYREGKVIWTSRVGVGTSSTPTPAGRFYIRERLRNFGGNAAYGPWALGTSAYAPKLSDWPGGGVIGIHGTNQPGLIPGRPSHGCIRVPNYKISRLARIIAVGTPLEIL